MSLVFRYLAGISLCIPFSSAFTQWQNVAPGLLQNFSGRTYAEAAMTYNDGMLWIGRSSLWVSADTGRTWRLSMSGFQGQIREINAFDRNICVFATNAGDLFITKNAGLTWQLLTNLGGAIQSVTFFDDPRHIIAFEGGFAHVTHDGGATWLVKQISAETLDSKWIGGGTLLFQTGNVATKQASISISTDYGETWSKTGGVYDYDSYTFDVNSCDPSHIIVANEDYLDPTDGFSSLFRSTDKGATWQTILQRNRGGDFFCGSIVSSSRALFVQMHSSGVLRSTDDGLTWITTGGPNGDFDTRLLVAVNSNIVFAVDQSDGSVYRTFNSGGDSIAYDGVEPMPLAISPTTLFAGDTVDQCDSTKVRAIVIRHRECTTPSIASATMGGDAASDYSVVTPVPTTLTGSDTIRIKFDPSTTGERDATYTIMLADGRRLEVRLMGTGSGIDTVLASPARLDFDTLYTCDDPTLRTIFLSYIGCNNSKKVSESVVGSQDFTIIAPAPDSIDNNDFVRIAFVPTTGGAITGTYVLTLASGKTITIPLTGFGIASESVSISTIDVEYDTLGVPVFIPFAIKGIVSPTPVELVVHYGSKLEYLGTRSVASGMTLDIPGQQFSGRSKIRIPANQISPLGMTGYAVFNLIADSVFTPTVTFDSLSLIVSTTPCAQTDTQVVSTILLPPGCDYLMIADFFYHGTPPTLSIAPNPSSGDLVLTCDRTLGDAELTLFDQAGKLAWKTEAAVQKNTPLHFDFNPASSGYYSLVITTPFGAWNKGILIQK